MTAARRHRPTSSMASASTATSLSPDRRQSRSIATDSRRVRSRSRPITRPTQSSVANILQVLRSTPGQRSEQRTDQQLLARSEGFEPPTF